MRISTERRRDDRIAVRLEAHFSFGRVVEVGVLSNISYSGALIEGVTMQPKVGTHVVVGVHFKPPSGVDAETPFELSGEVVRLSENGFALEYENRLDPEVRRMVDEVAAIVADEGATEA